MGRQAKQKELTRRERDKLRNPPWTKFQEAAPLPNPEVPQYLIDEELEDAVIFKNSRYQVLMKKIMTEMFGEVYSLSIRRLDRQPIHDWRDLQRIKNELVHPECDGFEMYPAESRLVDTANQYYIWVLADKTKRIPVGFTSRAVDGESKLGAVQRPLGS